MKKYLLICLLVVTCLSVRCQQLIIDNTSIENERIKIHYTLKDTTAGNRYTVRVYGSHDNYLSPLESLEGASGINIGPGSHELTWNPGELGTSFAGSIALEVRARIYVPFVQFEGFEEYKKIKRLKPYTLTWSGGTERNILNFDLMKGDKKVLAIPGIANTGHHTLVLPQSIKPGDYNLRISDSKNKDEVVFSDDFKVQRKWPLLIKVLPVLVVGGVISQLVGKSDPFEIPDPISPQ
ncbi:MAG: hypothetical protein R2820_01145 [Cyclobacteriaceae bacterium]|nr:hypothetical protein [Cyclobacteriaceae bacterium]